MEIDMKKLLFLTMALVITFCRILIAPPSERDLYKVDIRNAFSKAYTIDLSIQPYLEGSSGAQALVLAEEEKKHVREATAMLFPMITVLSETNKTKLAQEIKAILERAQMAATAAGEAALQHISTRLDQRLAVLPHFITWAQVCNSLPFMQHSLVSSPMPNATPIPIQLFSILMDNLIERFNQVKNNRDLWLTPLGAEQPFYVTKDSAQIGETLYIHADVHGDVKSLIRYLSVLFDQTIIDGNWKIAPHSKLIFLGDYIDRGLYGLEVLYTLMILAYHNPGQVLILRGNHEDNAVYRGVGCSNAGYNEQEISQKLSSQNIDTAPFFDRLDAFFDTLPSAAYIQQPNNRFLLCTHGAHDHTHASLPAFLHNAALRFDAYSKVGTVNNYSWSVYTPQYPANTEPLFNRERGAGFIHYRTETLAWMRAHEIDTIIHGHEHTTSQLWNSPHFNYSQHNPKNFVYGLPVDPNTYTGQDLRCTDSVYGIIKMVSADLENAATIKFEKIPILPPRE